MKIAIVQHKIAPTHEEAVSRGLAALSEAASAGAKLVVYPELSFTPFYPQYPAPQDTLDLAEPLDGATVSAFRKAAADHEIVTVINLFERDGDQAFNTSPIIDADGSLLGITRMIHITDYPLFFERGYYRPGDRLAPVFDTAVGRIGVAICYDRHYPEYMRSLALQGADLVLIPQAGVSGEWPDGMYEDEIQVTSFHHGFYCALANRSGREDKLSFCGGSFVTDPHGRIIAQAPQHEETILYAEIDSSQCADSPARKLFLRDRRPDIYEKGAIRIPD